MSKAIKTLTTPECDKLIGDFLPANDDFCDRRRIVQRYLLLILFLDAGLRLQEALQMRIMDLIWESEPLKVITVRWEIAKNKTAREIPASIRLTAAIKLFYDSAYNYANRSPADFAFVSIPGGKPLSSRSVEYWLKAAGHVLIGKKVTPHMLRHTFATRLMRKCSIRVVQMLLGHKSLSSTQVYTHPNSDDLTEAINSI